ncbi:MAG: integral rane sensor signal transduction histidine kinase [Hydrocarboniphaga sp.]|uniref:sensor histidine kinase n=1 Tax=Hydrocarboniphaga sp. TaxID=2033016 RepID=UPI00261532D8|nr:ATP-binding protein [Hydrocarboniphaga sp.]MDB5970849.1 integral rane sensor signal transduction histidine kinase [Hydrocarboniphaga sp.]
MFGLTLRVTVVMVGAMLLAMLITGGAFLLQREAESSEDPVLPLPARVAAIVKLLEASPPTAEYWLLRSLSDDDDLDVRLQPGGWVEPAAAEADFPAVLYLLKRELGDRRVDIGVGAAAGTAQPPRGRLAALLGRNSLRTGQPLQLRVELRDGRVAIIDIHSGLLARPLAGQLVTGTALLILLTVLFSAWSLKRQVRPLETLAGAVERFGQQIDGAALPRSNVREVQQLVTAFDLMRDRVRGLLDGRTRMLAAISHDLGTYLTRLRLRVEYIDDATQRERAVLDLGHMQQLLRDTLTLARLDSAVEVAEPVDVVKIAQQQADSYRELQQPVSFTPPLSPIFVAVRGAALARVLDNLIGNALKHAGAAELSVIERGSEAEIRIEDRGPGIPADQRELVLEPFYRLDQARTLDVQGSGLGLAIVADIVRRYGGRLLLDDREGGGLRVGVWLPRLT